MSDQPADATLTPLQEAALHGMLRVAAGSATDEQVAESMLNAVLDAQREMLGIKDWWIERDGNGDLMVWRPRTGWPASPQPLASDNSLLPEVWAVLTALLPTRAVEPETLTCGWGGCGRSYDPADGADEIFCSEECRADEAADNEKSSMDVAARMQEVDW